MATRVGINGFGRMGRLALRAGWGRPDLDFVHINEIAGGAPTAARLLTFDSVHGRWGRSVEASEAALSIDGRAIAFSAAATPGAVPWSTAGVDVVLECSGKFRTTEKLECLGTCFSQVPELGRDDVRRARSKIGRCCD